MSSKKSKSASAAAPSTPVKKAGAREKKSVDLIKAAAKLARGGGAPAAVTVQAPVPDRAAAVGVDGAKVAKGGRRYRSGTVARRLIHRYRHGMLRNKAILTHKAVDRMVRKAAALPGGRVVRIPSAVVSIVGVAAEAHIGRYLRRIKLLVDFCGAKGISPRFIRLEQAMSQVGFNE